MEINPGQRSERAHEMRSHCTCTRRPPELLQMRTRLTALDAALKRIASLLIGREVGALKGSVEERVEHMCQGRCMLLSGPEAEEVTRSIEGFLSCDDQSNILLLALSVRNTGLLP